MRKLALSSGLSALLLTAAVAPASAAGFTLSSPDVKPGSMIGSPFVFNSFGCTGQNLSPALAWSGAPAATKSFVLTVYDPDAPTGSGFWHWVMYNIPASVSSLPQGAGAPGKEPAGAVEGTTDYGAPGYGGPCPPKGDKPHHYTFTVYAIDVAQLPVDEGASGAMVVETAQDHLLGKGTLVVTQSR